MLSKTKTNVQADRLEQIKRMMEAIDDKEKQCSIYYEKVKKVIGYKSPDERNLHTGQQFNIESRVDCNWTLTKWNDIMEKRDQMIHDHAQRRMAQKRRSPSPKSKSMLKSSQNEDSTPTASKKL